MPELEDSSKTSMNIENFDVDSTNSDIEGLSFKDNGSNVHDTNSEDGYKKRLNNKTRRYALKRGKIPRSKDVLYENSYAGAASISDVENDAISRASGQQHDFNHVKKTTEVVGEGKEPSKLVTERRGNRSTARRIVDRHRNLSSTNRKPQRRGYGIFQRIKNLFVSIFRCKRSNITTSNQRTAKTRHVGSRSGSTRKKQFRRSIK